MMLKFCRLYTGEDTNLPKYLKLMHEKNVSDSRKEEILFSQLKNNNFYNGAWVYVSNPLL